MEATSSSASAEYSMFRKAERVAQAIAIHDHKTNNHLAEVAHDPYSDELDGGLYLTKPGARRYAQQELEDEEDETQRRTELKRQTEVSERYVHISRCSCKQTRRKGLPVCVLKKITFDTPTIPLLDTNIVFATWDETVRIEVMAKYAVLLSRCNLSFVYITKCSCRIVSE